MAIQFRTENSNTIWLTADGVTKRMFVYSKEEQEGYEKYVSKNGNISYRCYVSNVSGFVTGAYFKPNNFGSKDFHLVISDEEAGERYNIAFDITGSPFMALVRNLDNLDVSKKIKISVYPTKSEKTGKEYVGVSISYEDLTDEEGKPLRVTWGRELTAPKQLRSGKWDFTEMNDDAFVIGEEFITKHKFDSFQPKENTTANNSEKAEENTNPFEEDEDGDELPF